MSRRSIVTIISIAANIFFLCFQTLVGQRFAAITTTSSDEPSLSSSSAVVVAVNESNNNNHLVKTSWSSSSIINETTTTNNCYCTLANVGLGRWVYEHVEGGSNRAKVETAQWEPLECVLPTTTNNSSLEWSPEGVLKCVHHQKSFKNVVSIGGSTTRYLIQDFMNWMQRNSSIAANNFHSKIDRYVQIKDKLAFLTYRVESAGVGDKGWKALWGNEALFENSLILFNSGLWDMRYNNMSQYTLDVDELAKRMSEYAKAHPSNRVIWRSSGTPNWNRLDGGRGRALERLLNPDNVFVYNEIAAKAMTKYGVEVFDNYLIVLGRPEETRTERDGLHPSTKLNLEMMKIILSVICAE